MGHAEVEALQSLPFHNLPVPGNKKLQENHPSGAQARGKEGAPTSSLTLQEHTVKLQQCCHPLLPSKLSFPTLCFVGHFCFGFNYFLNHHIPQSYAWSCAPTRAGASKGFENRLFGIAAPWGKCLKDPGEKAGDSSISDQAIHSLQLQADLRQ